jgi:hypothetical protein
MTTGIASFCILAALGIASFGMMNPVGLSMWMAIAFGLYLVGKVGVLREFWVYLKLGNVRHDITFGMLALLFYFIISFIAPFPMMRIGACTNPTLWAISASSGLLSYTTMTAIVVQDLITKEADLNITLAQLGTNMTTSTDLIQAHSSDILGMFGGAFCVFLVSVFVCFYFMNPEKRHTFWRGDSMRWHIKRYWDNIGDDDKRKATKNILVFHPTYLPKQKVQSWLTKNKPLWDTNPPDWYDNDWKQAVQKIGYEI